MTKQEALPVRVFIGLFALVALVTQLVVIPRTGAAYASSYPEVSYLEQLYVPVLMVALVGLDIALLSAWQLTSTAVTERAVGIAPRRWSNVMTASLIFMATIFAGICVHAGSVAGVGGPAMLFGLLASLTLIVLAFALRHWIRGWLLNEGVYTSGVV